MHLNLPPHSGLMPSEREAGKGEEPEVKGHGQGGCPCSQDWPSPGSGRTGRRRQSDTRGFLSAAGLCCSDKLAACLTVLSASLSGSKVSWRAVIHGHSGVHADVRSLPCELTVCPEASRAAEMRKEGWGVSQLTSLGPKVPVGHFAPGPLARAAPLSPTCPPGGWEMRGCAQSVWGAVAPRSSHSCPVPRCQASTTKAPSLEEASRASACPGPALKTQSLLDPKPQLCHCQRGGFGRVTYALRASRMPSQEQDCAPGAVAQDRRELPGRFVLR